MGGQPRDKRGMDRCHNAFCVAQDIRIPKAGNFVPASCKITCPLGILRYDVRFHMAAAVEFDDKLGLMMREIRKIRPYRRLPAEMTFTNA